MATSIKVAVIGAGSATFSLGLVKDLCLTPSLAGSQVSFMDIDSDRLEMIHSLAVRYAEELGADLRFESTTDRRGCLSDADFCVNTAAVWSHEQQIEMRGVAEKHGYYYGTLRLGSFYNLRLMLDVAHDMEDVCPDAWLIQSGNPVSTGSTLVGRETDIKVCGLCHGHYGYRDIAEMIGLDPDQVTYQAPGLNHNIWLTHFVYKGEDAYPRLDEWIENEGEAYWSDATASREDPRGWSNGELARAWEYDMARGAIEQYRMYGLMPVGDTTRRPVAGWWLHTDLATKKRFWGEPWGGPDTELSWPLYVENLERRIDRIRGLVADAKARVTDEIGASRTREGQVGIMDSLVNDVEAQFQVNVPNRGILAGLPDDIAVEVQAVVDGKGIQPIQPVDGLPPKIMFECILPEWLQMEREMLALQSGDRSMLLWDVLDNHQTRSYDQATQVLKELLGLECNRELDAHFRWPSNW